MILQGDLKSVDLKAATLHLSQMNIKEKIGARIKEIRHKKKISQEALAHLAELDRTYMNSVENGRRNISIENIERIAKALKVSVSDFFDSPHFH